VIGKNLLFEGKDPSTSLRSAQDNSGDAAFAQDDTRRHWCRE